MPRRGGGAFVRTAQLGAQARAVAQRISGAPPLLTRRGPLLGGGVGSLGAAGRAALLLARELAPLGARTAEQAAAAARSEKRVHEAFVAGLRR